MRNEPNDPNSAPHAVHSLVDLLRQRAEAMPDRLAYQFLVDGRHEGPRLTYAELDQRARAIAAVLRRVAPRGARALLMYPAGLEFLPAFFGCLNAGIIAIPVPPPDTARLKRALPRLSAVVADADATLALTSAEIHAVLVGHLGENPEFHRLTWLDTDRLDAAPSGGEVGGENASEPGRPDRPAPHDIAFLQYTSGSTADPKGVIVSHANVLSLCRALAAAEAYAPDSVTATWMPNFHDYGLIEGLLLPLFVGIPCHCLSPIAFIRRPIRWLEAIDRYRVTHSQAPNFAYDLCLQKTSPAERAALDLGRWQSAGNGAEPIRPTTLRAFHEAFAGCGLRWQSITPAYGLAEATLHVSVAPAGRGPLLIEVDATAFERGQLVASLPDQGGRTMAGSGRVLDGIRVEIVDPVTHRRCGLEQVGEIWVAGPTVALGYWNRQQETTDTFHARLADTDEGPFLRTGDLGCLREGELFVTGRLKDLIIVRGLNHSPQDIELSVERGHPALRPGNGAAFTVEVGGEEELVVVQEIIGRRVGADDAGELLAAIRAAVFDEHDLRLRSIVLLASGGIHKTTSGKIQRQAVKAAFLAGTLQTVARWDAKRPDPPVAATGPSCDSIAAIIVDWLAGRGAIAPGSIDTSRPFADAGLDSLGAVELAHELECRLQKPVPPTVFWNHPSIDALAAHLADERPPAVKAQSSPNAERTVWANDDIAIVGIGCRFPGGVDSAEAYWNLLERGGDAVGEIPADRWDTDAYYNPDPTVAGTMYTRHGAFVGEVDRFDTEFFRLTPREAEEIDPQQRLLLEIAWEALEHAGLVPSRLHGSDTGVFIGSSSDDHATWRQRRDGLTDGEAHRLLGAARSIAAGRIAYVLGLHGPVVQLDTACSSSLVAVHLACQALLAGECGLALAGGVNLMLSPATTVGLCKLTALAADGRTKAFDAAADGYVRGEGCGLVVLKRMADAVRDGDTILARIRATAINHDGASNGLTAPNGVAQELLLRRTLQKAGVSGADVAYVEAHGTGTPLGDPIELEALNRVYGAGRSAANPLYIGSVKTNIGHLEAAAGIAGLIKVVVMLQQRRIAPQLHFHTPNPHLDWARMPLRVATTVVDWPGPPRAGVSAFGFSGTNAHVIVEAGPAAGALPANEAVADPASPGVPLHLFVLSARSNDSLRGLAQKYVGHLARNPRQRLEDICFTAATARDHFPHRLAVVAATPEELASTLTAFASGDDPSQMIVGGSRSEEQDAGGDIAFLFTGQGAQYAGMGQDLYDSQPVFRSAIDRCAAILVPELEIPLTELLFDDRASPGRIDQTGGTQPVMFALQYALVELWKSWGIRPRAVLGHSAGEYAAACTAGVFSLRDGLSLIATRGRLIQSLPQQGEMAVVMAAESRVAAALAGRGDRVSIAAINGPTSVVISGQREAVRDVLAEMRRVDVDTETLRTSNAGHSALMQPMLSTFRAAAEQISYAMPQVILVSNVTGRLADSEIASGEYWVRHVQAPVRFADGMGALTATGCRVFVEIGPGPTLLAMGMGCVKGRQKRGRWLPSLSRSRGGWDTLLHSLGEMYVAGAAIDWQGFHAPYARQRVALPTYAFDRRPCPGGPGPEPRSRSWLPSPTVLAREVGSMCAGLEDSARDLTAPLDGIALRYVIAAMRRLGLGWDVGAGIADHELDRLIPARRQPAVRRVMARLVDRGLLARDEAAYRVLVPEPDGAPEDLLEALERGGSLPEGGLLRRGGTALAELWRGEVEPLTILFPDASTDEAARFYSEATILAGYNRLAGEVVRRLVAALPAGKSLRILEVGAGTGGLTMHLLPHLPEGRSRYLFTDLSPLFLKAAEQRFRAFPSLETALLDIGRSPVEQLQQVGTGTFDLVVAANVLHATPRLRETLAHVHQLLGPGGWLMLLEGTNPPLWGDVLFTLIDGWWGFADRELRFDYPLLRPEGWRPLLTESGFPTVAVLNDARLGSESSNTLYLAQSGASAPTQPEARQPLVSSPTDHRSEPPPEGIQPAMSGAAHGDLTDLVRGLAARVMRVTAESIDLRQPLSELGLDSLMALELRVCLTRALGRELSLSPLRMRRSVTDIADALRDEGTGTGGATVLAPDVDIPRVQLVPLQPHGKHPPLFFVPAGYGDLLAFQDVANSLGADQPVYGLQPASARRVTSIRQMSIHRLVSDYLVEVRKVQPRGPYHLSGYSAGAIIAVEMAHELLRQGDGVGLLVIFDPPTHVPNWLNWFYSITYRLCLHTRLLDSIRNVRLRFVRRLFHAMLDEGLRTHTTVTAGHRVADYPGRITHFRARLSQSSLVSLQSAGAFWRRSAGAGIEVHWIPGTHYGMMRGAGAGVVVDELADCLARSRQRPGGGDAAS